MDWPSIFHKKHQAILKSASLGAAVLAALSLLPPAQGEDPLFQIHIGPPRIAKIVLHLQWLNVSEKELCPAEMKNTLSTVIENDLSYFEGVELSKRGKTPDERQKEVKIALRCKPQSGFMALLGRNKPIEGELFVPETLPEGEGGAKTSWRQISFSGKQDEQRDLAHTLAAAILKQFTGQEAPFPSKIAFVCAGSGHKELYLSDFDGYHPKQITRHQSILLSPSWDPTERFITYTLYRKRKNGSVNPDLMRLDLKTGEIKAISTRPGLNSGAAWSPDGEAIAVTLSIHGDPDLYLISPEGELLEQITATPGVDIEPSWSRREKAITFVSGRSGQPMVYSLSLEDQNMQRLTFAGIYNSSPAWSPTNDVVTFAGQLGSHFDLFMLDLHTRYIVRLTDGRGQGDHDEPAWAPTGTHIAFHFKSPKDSYIGVMRPDGTGKKRMTPPSLGHCTSPAWSPL
ncbi:MAG: PD40 domain-containing protein [Deltaproteobacteria bacterium]|nr:PD40 domain-containing protein [Deltaproteobacteria bacterium]